MLNQCLAKTNFFDFFGLNAVTANVSDSIWRPDELANPHPLILHQTEARRRHNAAGMPVHPPFMQSRAVSGRKIKTALPGLQRGGVGYATPNGLAFIRGASFAPPAAMPC